MNYKMYGSRYSVKEVLAVDLRSPVFAHAAFSSCAMCLTYRCDHHCNHHHHHVQSFCNCQHSLWWAG
jgi:hypothetical protein